MGTFDKPKKKRLFGPFSYLFMLALFMWSGGFIYFAQTIPDKLAPHDVKTDGIVVLTGGTQRLNTGLSLLSDGKAKKLLISGVYRGVELEELLSLSKNSPQELECCIDIGFDAIDTRSNATETAKWLSDMEYDTIRLVTANYHMPRSLLEFSNQIPLDRIVPHPVIPDNVRVSEWWRWPGTASLLVGEYNKFILVWLRQKIAHMTRLESLK